MMKKRRPSQSFCRDQTKLVCGASELQNRCREYQVGKVRTVIKIVLNTYQGSHTVIYLALIDLLFAAIGMKQPINLVWLALHSSVTYNQWFPIKKIRYFTIGYLILWNFFFFFSLKEKKVFFFNKAKQTKKIVLKKECIGNAGTDSKEDDLIC